MPNPWITALKKWNEGKETWCLPKKGSKAYDEVRALMPEKKLKASAEPEKAPAPAPAMPEPSKSKGPRIAPKKPIRGDVEPPAPPMKIPMEPQRKPVGDKDAPKVKFVEPAPKADDKETSNGELERFVPLVIKQLKVGDTLVEWFITSGRTWSNYISSKPSDMSNEEARMSAYYKIVSIHNNHSTFKVESLAGEKKTLRLQIYYESEPDRMTDTYRFALADNYPYRVSSTYVPTKMNASKSEIGKAYDKYQTEMDEEGWFGPRMEKLYKDMKERTNKEIQAIERKRNEESRSKREKEKQESINLVKKMIEESGGLQKLKKEDLKKIIDEYGRHQAYDRLWSQHVGGGYYSKTLPSKEKLIALINAFDLKSK
jgi:hypothetical protein